MRENPDLLRSINNWDISKVTDISSMFRNVPLNPDVSAWGLFGPTIIKDTKAVSCVPMKKRPQTTREFLQSKR